MRLNVDGYYEIGKNHSICEDYIFTERFSDDFLYGVVLDGCSGSAATDIGARIMAHHVKKAIREQLKFNPLFAETDPMTLVLPLAQKIMMGEAIQTAKMMDLPPECLDVSILIVMALRRQNKIIYSVIGWGDGVAIVKRPSDIFIYSVNYQPSSIGEGPYYLNYFLDPRRSEMYKESFPAELEMRSAIINTGDGKTIIKTDKRPYNTPTTLQIISTIQEPISSVSVSSDGLKTFNYCQIDEDSSLIWAAKRAVDFQSFEGVFVERRMKALARRDAKECVNHYDDISLVSILELPEETQ